MGWWCIRRTVKALRRKALRLEGLATLLEREVAPGQTMTVQREVVGKAPPLAREPRHRLGAVDYPEYLEKIRACVVNYGPIGKREIKIRTGLPRLFIRYYLSCPGFIKTKDGYIYKDQCEATPDEKVQA